MGLLNRKTSKNIRCTGCECGFAGDPHEELRILRTGHFLCSQCGHAIELDVFEPFTLMPCPYCDALIFVPVRIRDYYLFAPLGGGGMGSVYLSVSAGSPGKLFAVKTLPRDFRDNKEFGKELFREAETAALFRDLPGCETAVEYGYTDGEYFLVLDYVAGCRLDQLIHSQGRIACDEALRISLQVADTDRAIAKRGFLYRDLKPENVILKDNTHSRLIDFGLCVESEHVSRQRDDDSAVGSPHYMPPERLAGLPEGEFSEIYSLGMLLFHTVAGHTYFSDEEALELADQHISGAGLNPVSTRLPEDVPAPVCSLLDDMTRTKPSCRVQSFDRAITMLEEAYREITGLPCRPRAAAAG